MARDAALLAERNQKLRADFNRLKAEEKPISLLGGKYFVRLTLDQIYRVLSTRYYLSTRQVENILFTTEPHAAPLTTCPERSIEG